MLATSTYKDKRPMVEVEDYLVDYSDPLAPVIVIILKCGHFRVNALEWAMQNAYPCTGCYEMMTGKVEGN